MTGKTRIIGVSYRRGSGLARRVAAWCAAAGLLTGVDSIHKPEAQAKTNRRLSFASASGLYGGISELPEVKAQSRVSPREAVLLSDAADGCLDQHRLYEAALIASGATRDELLECRQRLAVLERELQGVSANGPPAEKARALFELLHRRVLRGGYEEPASNLAVTLRGGPYNCLSAVILFVDLAGQAGLEVAAVQTPGHVFCRLATNDLRAGPNDLDVELTCPNWFNRTRDAKKHTAKTYAAWSGDRQRRLSPVELVALVYFNRGVDVLARREFAAAAAANLTALALDPANGPAGDNLLATVNNWALAVASEGRPAEALRLVEAARAVAPENAHLLANERYLRGLIHGGGQPRRSLGL
jgi:tetratricopeptide (TPR) repeat protein